MTEEKGNCIIIEFQDISEFLKVRDTLPYHSSLLVFLGKFEESREVETLIICDLQVS